MRERVQNLTEEEFRTQVEAVTTKVAEKDYNLQAEHSRYWSEIASHKYIYDRQAIELEALRSLTLPEFKAHFERVFFSPTESKRLDFELNAVKFADRQAEWKAKNAERHYASGRMEIKDNLQTFKKKMSLHPDLFKANFASFRL